MVAISTYYIHIKNFKTFEQAQDERHKSMFLINQYFHHLLQGNVNSSM